MQSGPHTSGKIKGGFPMAIRTSHLRPEPGFHAFQLVTHYPGAGTGFAPVANRNTLIRAHGNIVVPVELMNFSIK